jgi:diaminohydroxyphosphoribosylaminopyrimidine deaminase/5-amino-6-(5-phosphoribosylamino)uracil reductase
VKTARNHPMLVFTAAGGNAALTKAGIEIVRVGQANGRVDLAAVMAELGKRGLTRVLVEGGPTLEVALLEAGLSDRVHLYHAPARLGGGIPGISPRVKADARFRGYERIALGVDVLESLAAKG